MGVKFTVRKSNIDESIAAGETSAHFVRRVAEEKALACAASLTDVDGIAVLAADTIVKLGEVVFGKPNDEEDARHIWQQLSNRRHQVVTAVSLLLYGNISTVSVSTEVDFAEISDGQMRAYWQSGEPQDKAGAYAIQGLASAWVKLISGSYSNVVGLPLFETNELLKQANLNWL